MKTREDLLAEARTSIREMTVQAVHAYLSGGNTPVLLDVRGLDEWERGHIKGAIHIPRGHLEAEVESRVSDKAGEVLVYCAGGVRSLLAGQSLRELGYRNVISMDGGFGDWEDAGFDFEQPATPEEDVGPVNRELLGQEIEHLEAQLRAKKAKLSGG